MKVRQSCRLINEQSSTVIVKDILLSITSNLRFFPLVKLESPSCILRWSFLLVFFRGCSTYFLPYGEGNAPGRKKYPNPAPSQTRMQLLYLLQSSSCIWLLTVSSPFLKCHLAQVISEREERALRWNLGRTPFALWKMPLGECLVLCHDCHTFLQVPAHCWGNAGQCEACVWHLWEETNSSWPGVIYFTDMEEHFLD